MDDEFAPRPIAGWFLPAAIASLLFIGLGCVSYLMHVLADPSTLPLDQRAAYEAEPMWVTAAYAVAVWVGLAGTILLVMRKRLAEAALMETELGGPAEDVRAALAALVSSQSGLEEQRV